MPVATTYPGVYIEEIPSGVHTITGVSTSITAFIGFTPRGGVNTPVHIFSFGDFERAFGGLAIDSLLSYCVKHFFQNGGTEAYVVRVASGAGAAGVTMQNAAATSVIDATASSEGTWGNNLVLDVDYTTSNPASRFNLTITEFVNRNGNMVANRVESFRNLSMSPLDSVYAIDTVSAGSELVQLALSPALAALLALPLAAGGASTSGAISAADLALLDATHNRLSVIVNGVGPYEIEIQTAPLPTLATLAADIELKINAQAGGGSVTSASAATTITITSSNLTPASSVHFVNASRNNAAAILHLGLANGGIEIDAVAPFRPEQTGTVGGALTVPATATGSINVEILRGASAAVLRTVTLALWGPLPLPFQTPPATAGDAVTQIRAAMTTAALADQAFAGASVSLVNDVLRIVPGPGDPNISFNIIDNGADVTATTLGLVGGTRNVARYAPGTGLTALAQVAGTVGNNGTAPGAGELIGSEALKTGIYALEDVDLFNLLVIPEATAGLGLMNVLTEAITYCRRRRAFMIIDAPDTVSTFAQAQTWIGGPASPLRSNYAALYFPRLREPDPLMGGVVRTLPTAGALAGLYARTDGERGVWKAPAGTAALLVGPTGLSYTLTDAENGTLNPLGLNCLRSFPVIGNVSWGARTARGADALADEYKYVPVRRLALFLEESMYRGTQWAVFEPNDEPLWAQIRLNLGAFMHTLYAQGAFQGRTPRDAYFVKCDKETTTQNDIDLGRVNIVVGFAPLKPAEFVIIQIQQIAGTIQT